MSGTPTADDLYEGSRVTLTEDTLLGENIRTGTVTRITPSPRDPNADVVVHFNSDDDLSSTPADDLLHGNPDAFEVEDRTLDIDNSDVDDDARNLASVKQEAAN